ncbi:MAG: Uma2 family endonuclease [Gemmatimonadaceae bacterium]|nr:Uma2 family endonuclease [Gloeobacterales cyanobacterium ES-bin-141]
MELFAPAANRLTFEEYLLYQGDPDVRYELVRGRLVPMATPSGLHTGICQFLVHVLQLHLVAMDRPLVVKTDLGVRTRDDTARIPDVVVCNQPLWQRVCARPGAGVLDLGELPLLVIEVTSENQREDYLLKRAEYALVEILEYWIVDPKRARVRVMTNPQGEEGYEHSDFVRGQNIVSTALVGLTISVDQIMSPPLVEDLLREEQSQLAEERQAKNQAIRQAEFERQAKDRAMHQTELERQAKDQAMQQVELERQRADEMARRLRELGLEP